MHFKQTLPFCKVLSHKTHQAFNTISRLVPPPSAVRSRLAGRLPAFSAVCSLDHPSPPGSRPPPGGSLISFCPPVWLSAIFHFCCMFAFAGLKHYQYLPLTKPHRYYRRLRRTGRSPPKTNLRERQPQSRQRCHRRRSEQTSDAKCACLTAIRAAHLWLCFTVPKRKSYLDTLSTPFTIKLCGR